MNQIPWFFVVLLLIGMLIHLGLGVYSRRFKIQSVQLPFEILMYFCVVWTATFALDISSDSLALKILLMKIRFLTTPFISFSLMLIAIYFSGHGGWLTKRRMAILLIIPIITVFLALTTEYSTVFRYNYTLVQTAGGFSVLGFTNGIWTRGIYLPFNYIEEAVTLLLLLQVIFGNQRLYARQALLFFVAVLIPVIADILFLFGITPVKNYNIVPSTFAFTGILLAIALFQYRFLDIVPVARNTLFERMSDPMLVIDREGRLADFNPAAENVLGLRRAKNLGKEAVDVLHEHGELCACIQEPNITRRHIAIGTGVLARVFDVSIEKLASGAGSLPERLITMRDVTEHKNAENELQKSREKYQALYNNMQEGVALHELVYDEMGQAIEYKIVDVNPKFESILNIARDVVINRLSTQAYGTSSPPYLSQYSAVAQSGIPQHFETYFPPLNKHLEISVSPWGRNGFATIFSDITKRKLAEEGRMQSEREKSIQNEIARVLLTTSDDDMYGVILQVVLKILDSRHGVFAYIDENGIAVAPSMLGKVMEQCNIADKCIRFPREDWGDNIWTRAILQKRSFIKNEPSMVPEGHLPIDNVMVVPISYHDRVIAHFEVANKNGGYTEADKYELEKIAQFISPVLNARRERDLEETKRKYAAQALRESEDYLNKLIGYANAPIIVWDPLRKIVRFNKAFERLTNYSADEVLGKDLSLLFPEVSREDSLHKIDSAALGEQWESVEIPILNKCGEVRIALWNSANIYTESGELQATIAQGQDITERKRAEGELALYARRLLIINRLDRVVTTSLDIEQVYDRFVENLKELVTIDRTSVVLLDESREHWIVAMIWTGYEPIIGKGEWRDVKGSAIEWLVSQKLPMIENEIGEKGEWTESEALRQENIRSRVLLPLILRGEVMGVLTMASRQPAAYGEKDLEILMPLSDHFSLAMQNSRLYDQSKQQSLQLEKTVEERTTQLQKANKELESFSYSVSHDLRSPLRAVDGFSRILLEEHLAELSPDAQHYLGLVRSNAVQMGHLIDDLLTFSRTSRQPLAKRLVNPAEVVNRVLEELQGELQGRNVVVIVGDLPPCQADPAMLKRVFFNLISNAVKFTRKKDEAHIDIGSINDSNGKTAYFVKDNGVGFDMRYSNKLFGVFSRLHSESDYEGTGVGLALVQRIVHRHGGRVWAEAEVNRGATFYFTLEGGEPL